MNTFQITLKPSLKYVAQRSKQVVSLYSRLLELLSHEDKLHYSELQDILILLNTGHLLSEDLLSALELIEDRVRNEANQAKEQAAEGLCGSSGPSDGATI